MLIGYARVSTTDQDLAAQTDALQKAGCEQIFTDKASGGTDKRPGLDEMLSKLRRGDTVVVVRLDRLGRSTRHLVNLMEGFQEAGINFRSLSEGMDTSTPTGKMIFQVFAAVAEFERSLIRERTMAGLEAARARGKRGGRPKGLSKKAEQKAMVAETLYKERKLSIKEICEQIGISRPTLYRYLRHRGVEIK